MKKILLILALSSFVFANESIKIAVGAGYKKPVLEAISKFDKKGIDAIFGNMKQVTTQAKNTNIALVIGDRNFFEKKSGLEILNYQKIGEGKVVVAYPKGKSLKDIQDLKTLQKIAMPEPQKAIYGIRGEEFLKNSKLYSEIKDRLIIVATVPQVASYVVANEVDAGILNLTATLGLKDKIGGYFLVPKDLYSPINIVAGELKPCQDSKLCKEFLDFLQSSEARSVFEKYGL